VDRRRKPPQAISQAARHKRDALIADPLPFVANVARRLARKLPDHIDLDDLIAAGNLGLIDAATRYDAKHGVSFEGFAETRIRGAMLDSIRANDTLSRDMRRVSMHLRDVVNELERALMRTPDQSEIAAHMGLTDAELAKMRSRLAGDRVVGYDEAVPPGRDFFELTADPKAVDALQAAAHGQMLDCLQAAIERLPLQMQRVLTLYFCQDLSLGEIGIVIERTESRACQILAQACAMLREDPALTPAASGRT
jgi:RNA polymerase sigma factor for flagellar operon FliA